MHYVNELVFLEIPSRKRCFELLEQEKVGVDVIKHSTMVCRLALDMTHALNDQGMEIDEHLVESGALLHDICRSYSNHALKGAKLLDHLGYPSVAKVIEEHMGLKPSSERTINEVTIVYLADKLVMNDERVSLQQRFEKPLSIHRHNPEIYQKINKKLKQAQDIEALINRICNEGAS
jgi:putative nucleotidyltransferase with HDIG domain